MTELNNDTTEVAPQETVAQDEQVATTEEVALAPETVSDTVEEKTYAGKFKTVEDLEQSYQELQSEFTKTRQAEHSPVSEQVPEPTAYESTPFDEETQQGLNSWYQQQREAEKAVEFERKHAKDLADPILAGTVQRIIADTNSKGERIDQEDALKKAQAMLNERLKPAVEQGVEEGKEVARKKQQAQAVGQTGKHQEIDTDNLSAEEFAKHQNIPRVN